MFVPDTKPYTRLRVKKLDFISLVDAGAQGPISNVALFKRAPEGDEFEAVCKVALATEVPTGDGKEPIGILFGWALAGTTDGGQTPHVDYQRDNVVVDDDLIKVAAAFMEAGSPADVMHENVQDGDARVLFMMPLTGDTLKAFGLKSDVQGLAIGMRPSKETFEKYRAGTLNAFSIAGIGERTLVDLPHLRNAIARIPQSNLGGDLQTKLQSKAQSILAEQEGSSEKRAEVAKYGAAANDASQAAYRASSDASTSSQLARASALHSDAAKAHADAGNQAMSAAHTAMANQSRVAAAGARAKEASAAAKDGGVAANQKAAVAHQDAADAYRSYGDSDSAQYHSDQSTAHADAARTASKRVSKMAVLTSLVDGHQHQIDLDDPVDCWRHEQLMTSPATSEGAEQMHSHSWVFDKDTGKITIGADSGHDHTVDAVVPADILAAAKTVNDDDDGKCAVPVAVEDEDSDAHSGPTVVVVQARAPEGASKAAPKYAVGDRVEATVDHMPGMKGMAGEIAIANEGTPPYYAVKFDDQDQMPGVHKWLAQNEIKPSPSSTKISMRAPETNSPRSEAGTSVNNEAKEHRPMSTDALQIMTKRHEDLEKRNVFLEKFILLSDAEREHYGKLVGQDKEVFLNKSGLERQVEISELAKADEVIYTSPVDGEVFRKSCNPRELKVKKQADEATIELRLQKQRAADLELAQKGAQIFTHIAKGAKGNIPGRLMKAINAEFTDPTDFEEVVEALKGLNAAMIEASKPKGVTPKTDVSDVADPQAQLDQLVKRHAEEKGLPFHKAYDLVLATDKGRALYAAADNKARA